MITTWVRLAKATGNYASLCMAAANLFEPKKPKASRYGFMKYIYCWVLGSNVRLPFAIVTVTFCPVFPIFRAKLLIVLPMMVSTKIYVPPRKWSTRWRVDSF